MSEQSFTVALSDEAATQRLGGDLSLALRAGDVLALHGDLGAGKSTLARALIRALADDPALEVPSPTFTLVQQYEARISVAHFDLYRLSASEELEELGLDEIVRSGAALIEWPERAGELLPTDAVTIELTHDGDGRTARISGPDKTIERFRRSLALRDFLETNGWGAAQRKHLLGDASARTYETVHLPGEPVRIAMNSPRLVLGPAVKDGKPYAEIAHTAQTASAFVAVDGLLAGNGVTVPDIYAADLDQGFLLVEHLGAEPFLSDGEAVPERYRAAAELLAHMHAQSWERRPTHLGASHFIFDFDRAAQLIEVELLTEWYLPYMTGAPASDIVRSEYQALWNAALDQIADGEKSILLRDYHSPNIIWREDRAGLDRLGVIDFQDAMIGSSAYDVASLAMDARVDISPDLEREIKQAYIDARRKAGAFDLEAFEHAYALMAAHRNSKILGGFVRLLRRDGKPYYIKHLPRIRAYVRRALAHPALADLRRFYEANGLLEDRA